MIAVIFEFWIGDKEREEYLEIAQALRTELDDAEGFISIERFSSISEPDKMLSLSFWENEAAVTAWRNRSSHRAAQAKGRARLFSDYRLRIADVSRDYTKEERAQTPDDSLAVHG